MAFVPVDSMHFNIFSIFLSFPHILKHIHRRLCTWLLPSLCIRIPNKFDSSCAHPIAAAVYASEHNSLVEEMSITLA